MLEFAHADIVVDSGSAYENITEKPKCYFSDHLNQTFQCQSEDLQGKVNLLKIKWNHSL